MTSLLTERVPSTQLTNNDLVKFKVALRKAIRDGIDITDMRKQAGSRFEGWILGWTANESIAVQRAKDLLGRIRHEEVIGLCRNLYRRTKRHFHITGEFTQIAVQQTLVQLSDEWIAQLMDGSLEEQRALRHVAEFAGYAESELDRRAHNARCARRAKTA